VIGHAADMRRNIDGGTGERHDYGPAARGIAKLRGRCE